MFRKINKESEDFEEKFWKSKSAETFFNNLPANIDDPMAKVFKNSMQIVMKTRSRTNINERLSSTLNSNIEKQMIIIEINLFEKFSNF